MEDSDTGYAGSLPDQLGILRILSHSGKGPGIRHTKVQWEVGTRYINPIQPYSVSRQLYLSYQVRLCTVIQLGIVRVVIWFPCWGPVGLRAGILMPRFCSSIPHHLGPLVWAPRSLVTSKTRRSLVTSKTRRSLVTSKTRRSLVTSKTRLSLVTRRVALNRLIAKVALRSLVTTVLLRQGQPTQQQLAACGSSPHAGWFAALSVPPGSPAALAPVSEPLGGVKPGDTQKAIGKRGLFNIGL